MIYLDHAATTPLDSRVLEAMMPHLTREFGNPSSIHQFGQRSRQAIDEARNTCLQLIGAFSPKELVFTGSGTESCNMAIFGAAFARQDRGKHLVVSAIEHLAVLEPARILRDNFGFELTEVLPDSQGIVHPQDVEAAIRPDTILISVMLANNEVGSIQPIKKIAKLARDRGILFHTDACQAPGFVDINVEHLGVDLMTLNGTKIYGPKGVGLLYIREGVKIMPLIHGGGQEFRMRGGTENVANIVGFSKALELVLHNSKEEALRLKSLQDDFLDFILNLPGVHLNGSRLNRLPNNVNVRIDGHSGETLVMRLDLEGFAVSSGSACSSGKTEASHVLLAMGQSPQEALQSLRITFGRGSTQKDVEQLKQVMSSFF
jgi:cysteine desulfurase